MTRTEVKAPPNTAVVGGIGTASRPTADARRGFTSVGDRGRTARLTSSGDASWRARSHARSLRRAPPGTPSRSGRQASQWNTGRTAEPCLRRVPPGAWSLAAAGRRQPWLEPNDAAGIPRERLWSRFNPSIIERSLIPRPRPDSPSWDEGRPGAAARGPVARGLPHVSLHPPPHGPNLPPIFPPKAESLGRRGCDGRRLSVVVVRSSC